MKILSYRELKVYQLGKRTAFEIYQLSKSFPQEERYSMVDQIRRSSRSVCTNIAEAWRKRRYPANFVSKLSDAETEAEETRVWLEFAVDCRYLDAIEASRLDDKYDHVISQLVLMISEPEKWTLPEKSGSPSRPVAPSPRRGHS